MKPISGQQIASALIVMIAIVGSFASVSAIPDATTRRVVLAVCIVITIAAIYLFISTYVSVRGSIHNLKALRSLRIKRLFTNGTAVTETMRAAINGAKSVSVMAVSAESLIKSLKNEIIYALRKNSASIRVLLAAPSSEFVSDIEETESRERIGHITPEISKVESLLREYLDDAKASAKSNMVLGRVWHDVRLSPIDPNGGNFLRSIIPYKSDIPIWTKN